MGAALNVMLRELGKDEIAIERIRPYVSRGAPGVVKMALGYDLEPTQLEQLRQRFLVVYTDINGRDAELFPAIDEVLVAIENSGRRWGIVTNKPGWLTEALLTKLDLMSRLTCLVSGDTLALRKPDPAPLVHAADLATTAIERCVYIGDDARDMEAAEAAGMAGVIARYGYIPDDENPDQWPAAASIDAPRDLLPLLGLK